jgi:CheY-like chemotaxis protein
MIRLLVAEDERHIQLLFTTNLRQAGYDVVAFDNGVDALNYIHQNGHLDAVISDIRMPRMDGFQLLDAIKESHSHLPVILCSAYLHDQQEATSRGADGCLPKPFSRQQLLDAVRAVL